MYKRQLVGSELTFEVLAVAGDSEHGYEMASRRGAVDRDALRVETVFLRIGLEPADRRLAVVELLGPLRLAAETVADRDAGVAARGQVGAQAVEAAILRALSPATAVDVGDDRQGSVGGAFLRQGEVECLARIVGAGVGDVLLDLDALEGARLPRLVAVSWQAADEGEVLSERDEAVLVGVDPPEILPVALGKLLAGELAILVACLLYTSPSPRD